MQKGDIIDWNSAVVLEKIDGCLLKYFNFNGNWIWVTNNGWDLDAPLPLSIDSGFEEKGTESAKTFKDLKDYALLKLFTNMENFDSSKLDPNFTYMFEIISPRNRIICTYKSTELYFLGARNKNTYEEVAPEYFCDNEVLNKFPVPKQFTLSTINDVLALCDSYHDNFHEGVVVRDKYFHRIKIKCAHYLKLKGFKHQIGITKEKLFDCVKSGAIDDIYSVFPELISKLNQMSEELNIVYDKFLTLYDTVSKMLAENNEQFYENDVFIQKKYANWVLKQDSLLKHYLFLIPKMSRAQFLIEVKKIDFTFFKTMLLLKINLR